MSVNHYTAGQLDAIASKLREMPPTEDYVLQKAISTLASEIFAMKKRGYTYNQILGVLRGAGLQVTVLELKNHLQRARYYERRA